MHQCVSYMHLQHRLSSRFMFYQDIGPINTRFSVHQCNLNLGIIICSLSHFPFTCVHVINGKAFFFRLVNAMARIELIYLLTFLVHIIILQCSMILGHDERITICIF